MSLNPGQSFFGYLLTNIDVVHEAFAYVKNLEKNKAAKLVLKAFPYYPLQHDFPILEYERPCS